MKKIFKIAQTELSILFYSPVAWLILIIFIIQCGLSISDLLEANIANQELGSNLKSLTQKVFGGIDSFFKSVKENLYLYIPLLTMGLMSRELSSGSIKLLLSSPVQTNQIILGKFLAMVVYNFLLVFVLLGVVLMAAMAIESIDLPYLLGGIFGLFLLACAYSAIGIFMSSLTTYQLVAAISTLAVFAALNFMGSVGQSIDLVRDITYWMSISDRVDNFIIGLISSKDVIYFVLIILLFLTLTIMRFNDKRKTYSRVVKILRYSGLVVSVLLVGYLSSVPKINGYYDTTRFKTKTLTENTQKLLEQLDETAKITVYPNVLNAFANIGAPKFRIFDLKQFDEYTRFLPDLKIDYQPYYNYTLNSADKTNRSLKERALRSSIAHGYDFEKVLSPEEIHKIIDVTPEANGFVRVLESNGKKARLRMFYDGVYYPKEPEIAAAVKNILVGAPEIKFLTGRGERNINKRGDKDYKKLLKELNDRSSLINQGFNISDIILNDHESLPSDISALVIADPVEAYGFDQKEKIKTYIKNGGNVIIAIEPGKQDVFNSILKSIGVQYSRGRLLSESKDYKVDLIQAQITDEAEDLGFSIKKDEVVSMPNSMAITFKDTLGFKAIPILKTNKEVTWNHIGEINFERDSVVFNHDIDTKEGAIVALALNRKIKGKEQKIMVIGDADLMSNKELSRNNLQNQVNYEFSRDVFKWFSNGEYPIDVPRPDSIDNNILVSQEQLSWMKLGFVWGFPLLLAISGMFILVRRMRN